MNKISSYRSNQDIEWPNKLASADRLTLLPAEKNAIINYQCDLISKTIQPKEIKQHLVTAKVILKQIYSSDQKAAPIESTYRNAVDSVLPCIKEKPVKEAFLGVARGFYPYLLAEHQQRAQG